MTPWRASLILGWLSLMYGATLWTVLHGSQEKIKSWQDFLDSLATAGGNIVTLFICSASSAALWMWVYTHNGSKDLVMATFGVFTGFTGALLQAQKGNSSRQQMQDRIDTTRPTGAAVNTAGTVNVTESHPPALPTVQTAPLPSPVVTKPLTAR